MKNGTGRILKSLVPLGLGLCLSFVGIYVVMHVSFTKETWVALRKMNPIFLLYCLGMVFTAWICNGLRLKILSRALGYHIPLRRCVRITLSSEFGIAATPAGVGGGVLKIYLVRRQGVAVGHAASIFATDMTLDFLFVLIVLPLGLSSFLRIFSPLVRKPTESVLFFIGAGFLLLLGAIIYWRYRAVQPGAPAVGGESGRPRGLRGLLAAARGLVHKWSREFRTGFATLLHLRRVSIAAAFMVSIVQWTCRYGILVVILRALGEKDVNPFALFILQGLLFLGSLVLVIPGGGGGVEAAFGVTVSQLVPGNIVGVALLLWRIFTYYVYLIGGGIMLLITAGKGAFTKSLGPVAEDIPPAEERAV